MTDKPKPHRWTSDTDRVRSTGERITNGDAFAATEHELRCWPTRIEEIEQVADEGTCTEIIESGEREGEVCGRERPCSYHDEPDSE